MNPLVAAILALAVLSMIGLSVDNHVDGAVERIAAAQLTRQTAQEQVQFAMAVENCVAAYPVSQGASITVSELQNGGAECGAGGYLPAGYLSPSGENPLEQTPVAYAGSGGVVLAYYRNAPNPERLASLGVMAQNPMAEAAIMRRIAARAAAMSDAMPQLTSVAISAQTASTPYGGYTASLSQFTTAPNLSAPSFGILLNALPVTVASPASPTASTASTTGNPILALQPGQSYTDPSGDVFTAYSATSGTVIGVQTPAGGPVCLPQSAFSSASPSLSNYYAPHSLVVAGSCGNGSSGLSTTANGVNLDYQYYNPFSVLPSGDFQQ